jgi:hypothetical protein
MLRDHSPSGNQKLAWAATSGELIDQLARRKPDGGGGRLLQRLVRWAI